MVDPSFLNRMLAAVGLPLALALMVGCNGQEPVAERPLATVNPATGEMAADENGEANMPASVVQMTNGLRFQPETVTVEVGETVQWRNMSQRVHTVTGDPSLVNDPAHVELPEGAEPFDSGRIEPGGMYEQTFDAPGRYRYFCMLHEDDGMLGELIVEPERDDVVEAE